MFLFHPQPPFYVDHLLSAIFVLNHSLRSLFLGVVVFGFVTTISLSPLRFARVFYHFTGKLHAIPLTYAIGHYLIRESL